MLCIVVLVLVALVCVTGGCGRAARTAKATGEAMRVAQDAQDGKFTVKNEKGEEMKVEVDKEGKGSLKMTGPDGTTVTSETGTGTVTQEEMGIDFYPGATVKTGTTMSQSGEKGGTNRTALLETSDPFDKVAKFYRDKYAKGNTVMEQPNMLHIMVGMNSTNPKTIVVTREEGQAVTTIALGSGTGS